MRIETGSLRCAAVTVSNRASKAMSDPRSALKGYDSNFFENRRRLWNRDSIATYWTES